jgi:PKD repeat protein
MKTLLSILLLGAVSSSFAQLSIVDQSTNLINFDNTVNGVNEGAYNGLGFESNPVGGQLDADAWKCSGLSDGTTTFGMSASSGDYAKLSSAGGESSGGFYAFDVEAGNAAFGFQATGSDFTPGDVTFRVQNNSGADITALNIDYVLWIFNDQPRSNSVNFSWSVDDIAYTSESSVDYNSVETADGSPEWLDENMALTISGLSIADGAFFYLRWESNDVSGSGSRDEFALDDIEISAVVDLPNVNVDAAEYIVDETGTSVDLTLSITNSNGAASSVDLQILSGSTATNGSDYTMPTTLSFDGITDETLTVTILLTDDNDVERTEYIGIKVLASSNVLIGSDDMMAVYLKDDDFTAPVANGEIELEHLTSYAVVGGSAEISAYDPSTNKLYVANSIGNTVEILDLTNPSSPLLVSSIDISIYGNINSIAVYNDTVALAIANSIDPQANGLVVFIDGAGTYINDVAAGANPDMIVYTPDHQKLLVANEGEPDDDYLVDPEGSITIIDISNGALLATQVVADFSAYNGQQLALVAQGVRIFGPGASVAQDLEPEYITIDETSTTAWITLQENNAIAKLDIATATITDIYPMGLKDFSLEGNALDISNDAAEVLISNWPVYGMYMPDAIASFEVGGITYLVTANEGDSRDYDGYSEEERLKDTDYILDASFGDMTDFLKVDENAGRVKLTLANGDTDNDGDYDSVFVYGSRSFSIWDENGNQIWDSGDDFEQIVAADPIFGAIFNCSNDNVDFKDRSDDKGPEPEGIVTGVINDTTYAFITLERVGGIMVYNISDVNNPSFVQYINTRDVLTPTGDMAPEGILFIDDANSPIDTALVIVSNEVSGTVSIFKANHYMFFEPAADFSMDTAVTCENGTVQYTDLSTEEILTYTWAFEGGTPPTSSDQNPSVNYAAAGTYQVKLVVSNPAGIDSLVLVDTILVNANPVMPLITLLDGETIESSSAIGNQWNDLLGAIAGEVNQTLTPLIDGDYTVTITNSDNCSTESANYSFVNSVGIEQEFVSEFKVYPNPTANIIFFNSNADVVLMDVNGKVLIREDSVGHLDLSLLSKGIYFLSANGKTAIKIIKE